MTVTENVVLHEILPVARGHWPPADNHIAWA